jgi:hypothetical protein
VPELRKRRGKIAWSRESKDERELEIGVHERRCAEGRRRRREEREEGVQIVLVGEYVE